MVLVGRRSLAWFSRPQLSLRATLVAAAALGAALLSAAALGLMVRMSDGEMLEGLRGQAGGLWIALIAIAGVGPLLEEWIFRGALLELLLVVFGRSTAAIVTALLFAFVHLSPPTIVHHGLLGYVCARVRMGSGSLWPAIACHAAYNAVVVLSVW
jgi:membrane protease YdiL (CAAX protease family)